MRPAALIDLRPICLDPPPDATGINEQPSLGQKFGYVQIRKRVPQIPPHRHQDDLTRVLASLERIGRDDRHRPSYLIRATSEVRNGTLQPTTEFCHYIKKAAAVGLC